MADAFENSAAKLGSAWGIFANAGIDEGGLIHELPIEKWNRVIAVNLTVFSSPANLAFSK